QGFDFAVRLQRVFKRQSEVEQFIFNHDASLLFLQSSRNLAQSLLATGIPLKPLGIKTLSQ
ncbi:MAG: hypothetical protein V1817_03945, partial [Candidatus Micrarchaeota archaeon]